VSIIVSGADVRSFIGTSDVKAVLSTSRRETARSASSISAGRSPMSGNLPTIGSFSCRPISSGWQVVAYCGRDIGMSGPSKITPTFPGLTGLAEGSADCGFPPIPLDGGWTGHPEKCSSCIRIRRFRTMTTFGRAQKPFMQKIIGGQPIGTRASWLPTAASMADFRVTGCISFSGFNAPHGEKPRHECAAATIYLSA